MSDNIIHLDPMKYSAETICWQATPLPPDSIHIIKANLAEVRPLHTHWLNSSELQRLDSLKNTIAAQQFVASRNLLHNVLSSYIQVSPDILQLATRPGGKPFITNNGHTLEFNLSHSNGIALLAVSQKIPLGIDIELIKSSRQTLNIAARIFSPAEYNRLLKTSPPLQELCFYEMWTEMEARQKAYGSGIFGDRVSKSDVTFERVAGISNYCATIAWQKQPFSPQIQLFRYT